MKDGIRAFCFENCLTSAKTAKPTNSSSQNLKSHQPLQAPHGELDGAAKRPSSTPSRKLSSCSTNSPSTTRDLLPSTSPRQRQVAGYAAASEELTAAATDQTKGNAGAARFGVRVACHRFG
jgi:hypothetical protein